MDKTVVAVSKVGKNYISVVKSPVYKAKNNVVRLNGDDVYRSRSKRRAKRFFDKLNTEKK